MFMLGLNETIDQLAMANCVQWHGHVLGKEDGDALRRALNIDIEGEKKRGQKDMEEAG